MEERPPQSVAKAGNAVSPSVAQLAGRFREQAAASVAKETPASKPTRRKPPCSLPLFPPKLELGQNGEKSSPGVNHGPKVKVKSSPLIEKLQASLAFDPTVLLPGASPKSPGLKAALSPFQSPPSTPGSPGEVPVSFDQPPEGSHLPCFNKVRTKGSIKRRPPSRRFRRSQSDFGDLANLANLGGLGLAQENGDSAPPAPAGPPDEGLCGRGAREKSGSLDELPARRSPGRTEPPPGEAPEAPQSPGLEAENGPGGPPEAERPEEAAETQEEEEAASESSPEEAAPESSLEEGAPQEGVGEGDPSPEQGRSEEQPEEGASPEPGGSPCQPEASGDAPPNRGSLSC
ncbi:capZ-interacting protein isoform X1 [Sorex araneus]|uniref:capZ-interacting protein isoform X1 n=1 Tax=Sorex araneus TaxID=42254 RepID=UPI002433AD81|nr:capZ-interacting protein isoform X1 [Sorex araneus]